MRIGGRKLWLSLFGLAILLLPGLLLLPSHEPLYKGKPISYWLNYLPITKNYGDMEICYFPMTTANLTESQKAEMTKQVEEAEWAVDYIGLQNLPLLLARLHVKDPNRWQIYFNRCAVKLHLKAAPQEPEIEGIKQGQALTAILRLGPYAHRCAPELIKMTRNPDPEIKAVARRALRSVAPEELAKLEK